MNPFAGQMWKFATGGAAIISLGLTIALTMAYLENKVLSHQIELTDHRVNDPKVGLVALLAQSETNVATLRTTLTTTTEVFTKQAQVDRLRLSYVSAQLVSTQRDNRRKQIVIERIMALPPKGNSIEDRYNDIDRRLLETLK